MAVATSEIEKAYEVGMSDQTDRSSRWSLRAIAERFPNLETYAVDIGTMVLVGGLTALGVSEAYATLSSPRMYTGLDTPENIRILITGTAAGSVIGGAIGYFMASYESTKRRVVQTVSLRGPRR